MQKITPPTFLNQISSNVVFLEPTDTLYTNFEKVDFSHFSHGKFLFPFKANTFRGAPLRHSKFQLNPFVGFFLANFFMTFWQSVLGSENCVMSQGLPRRAPLKKGTVTWGGSLGQKRRFSVKFECKLLHS